MNTTNLLFPAEWEPHDAIMLCWPHKNTDWAYMLDEVQRCYIEIAKAIVDNQERLIIISPECENVKNELKYHLSTDRIDQMVLFLTAETNDTWARDTCAISTQLGDTTIINDFKFNGWGLKFAADKDNLITHTIVRTTTLFENCRYSNHLNFVLEGGSVESDGNATILTTSRCLLSPNRNGGSGKSEIEEQLKSALGAKKILWLDHGFLEGDDTDSHIDTLARFAPDDTILYVGTQDKDDIHFKELAAMKKQLASFTSATGKPYKLVELPLPGPIFDKEGNRLPATYANFLIGNGFVLVPTYNQPTNDKAALKIIENVFKGYKIVGIDCTPLIKQHGSLHCATMQLPKDSLNIRTL